MENFVKNIETAEAIVKKLVAMKESYKAMQAPDAHINVHSHEKYNNASVPLDDALIGDVKELILVKIDEYWAELKDLLKDPEDVDDTNHDEQPDNECGQDKDDGDSGSSDSEENDEKSDETLQE